MGWKDTIIERKPGSSSTPNGGNTPAAVSQPNVAQPTIPQGSAPKETDGLEKSQMTAFLGGFSKPATLGLRDKIGALAMSMTTGLPYDKALAEVQQIYGGAAEAHPYADTLGTATGMIPMALASGSVGGPVGQFATGALTSLLGSNDPMNGLGEAAGQGMAYMLPSAAPLVAKGAGMARNGVGEGLTAYGKLSNIKGDLLQGLGNRMRGVPEAPIPQAAPQAPAGPVLPEAVAAAKPAAPAMSWGDPIIEAPTAAQPSIPGFGLMSGAPRPATPTVGMGKAEAAMPMSIAENMGPGNRIPNAKIPHDIERLLNPIEFATDSEIPYLLQSMAEGRGSQAIQLPEGLGELANMSTRAPSPKSISGAVKAASAEDPALGGAMSLIAQAKFPAYRKAVTNGSINPIATARPNGIARKAPIVQNEAMDSDKLIANLGKVKGLMDSQKSSITAEDVTAYLPDLSVKEAEAILNVHHSMGNVVRTEGPIPRYLSPHQNRKR